MGSIEFHVLQLHILKPGSQLMTSSMDYRAPLQVLATFFFFLSFLFRVLSHFPLKNYWRSSFDEWIDRFSTFFPPNVMAAAMKSGQILNPNQLI